MELTNKKIDFVQKETCTVCYKNFNARLNRIEAIGALIFVGMIANFFK